MSATSEDDAGSLTLSGDIDIAAVESVLARADRCLAARPSVLQIDLAAVTFIDSSGLGALVRIRKEAADQGTQVVLARLSRSSRRLLELSGLDQIFEIVPSETPADEQPE